MANGGDYWAVPDPILGSLLLADDGVTAAMQGGPIKMALEVALAFRVSEDDGVAVHVFNM